VTATFDHAWNSYFFPLKWTAAWVPSQKDLFCDAPQRHSVTRFRT